jgi:Rod binding domain-containing protein
MQKGVLDAQAGKLVQRTRLSTAALAAGKDAKLDAKIEKSSKDFESILLGSWLQGAEQSFATVPGGDGEDDDDSSKDQFQGIAMQALAGSMTASGGIGIAKMIAKHLRSSEELKTARAPESIQTTL